MTRQGYGARRRSRAGRVMAREGARSTKSTIPVSTFRGGQYVPRRFQILWFYGHRCKDINAPVE
jgi:hypothetical protein